MRNQAVGAIAEKTASVAAIHWQDCLEFGLTDHTPEAHSRRYAPRFIHRSNGLSGNTQITPATA